MSEFWKPTGFLRAAGKLLEYRCYGPPPNQKPTLVLLHEGLGSASLWRGFPELLVEKTGWGVLAYSRAGYGQSELVELPRPLDYMTLEAQDVISDVLSAAGIEQAVLFGHSDGGTIASIFAGTIDDDRLNGLIVMAPHYFTESAGLREITKAKQAYDEGDLKFKMSKYHRDADTTFRGWNDSWLHPDFESWNVADVLNGVNVPVLAIQGADDQYGTLRQIQEIEKRCKTPVTLLVLDGCRHSPHLDQPSMVLDAVNAYCGGLAVE